MHTPPGSATDWMRAATVHAVAEQVAALHDDVAEVDADTEPHALLGWKMIVTRPQRGLDLGRTTHRLDRAWKLGEYRVPGGIEDAAAMRLQQSVEDLAVGAQRLDG